MSIQAAVAFGIIGCILSLLMRQYQRPQAALLSIGVCCIVCLRALPALSEVLDTARSLCEQGALAPAYFGILCKALGIAYLTQLGTDICRDSGESAIATAVELCGRVSLVSLSLPVFLTLARTVLEGGG